VTVSFSLAVEFLGKPLWMWAIFFAVVLVLMIFDLGLFQRGSKELSVKRSLFLSAFYIVISLVFGLWVWQSLGSQRALEYVTGYVIEKSLSMDNIFVIALIFAHFAIPRASQYIVLFWGIIAVLVLRGIMIVAGAALVEHFGWVLWIFAIFLIFTGIRMLFQSHDQPDIAQNPLLRFMRRHIRLTQDLRGEHFVVREADPATGKTVAFFTPLFVVLVLVNVADVIFAVDSVPAIFAVTTDTYIVFTSNIFAVLGLRALYFALAAMIDRFAYLQYSLAAVLIFIGAKIVLADMLHIAEIPPLVSLVATFGILAAGILWSLWKTRASASKSPLHEG
jgi:tellurite resistance protein TerC